LERSGRGKDNKLIQNLKERDQLEYLQVRLWIIDLTETGYSVEDGFIRLTIRYYEYDNEFSDSINCANFLIISTPIYF
jgi:hypothetical protein